VERTEGVTAAVTAFLELARDPDTLSS
jgi:hypothetical protein